MSTSAKKRNKQISSKQPSQIPLPFTKAPESIQPLLDELDPSKVYITHIDRHPPEHKKQIFIIPVILNATIALLLAWRLYAALPIYWALLQTFTGQSSATVDVARTTRGQQIAILLKRTAMFVFDFFLARFVLPWPTTFFFEQPANPITWRTNVWFQKEEIVARVSRNWDRDDLLKGVKQGEESPFFKTRILPAISRETMQKTAYLMMGESWDLDFELMIYAHALVKQEKIKAEDLDKLVLVNQDAVGWLAWRWEGESDVVEARRQKVVAFKDKLTALGKESLFWRWTEIVEDERDADGGFSLEKQHKVAARVQAEFEKNGIDFDELVSSIGGLGGLPVKGG